MADRNLDLALRIRTDLATTGKELREIEKGLDGIGDAAQRSQGKLNRGDLGRNAVRQAKQLEEASRKISSAAGDLVNGNMRGATEKLAEGALRGAAGFGAMGLAVGGVVALLGLYATAVFKSYQDQQQFERALISTGNAVGMTAGGMADLRERVGEATGQYGDAKVALLALAGSGKIAGDSLAVATSAAVNLATLTGDSIESATNKILELADAPTEQLVKLNEQYHFLTAEVYEHVRSLEAQGRAEDAARVAIEEFARVHEQRVQEAYERAGWLEKAWINVRDAVKGAWQDIKDIGRTDAEARRAVQARALRAQTNVLNAYIRSGAGDAPLQAQRRVVLLQLERLNATRAEVTALEDKAKAQAEAQKVEDKAVDASAGIHKLLETGASKAEKFSKALVDLKKQFQALRKEAADGSADPLLEGVVFGPDGQVSGGAFDRGVEALKRRFKEPKGPKPPKPPKSEAEKAEDAGARELANLQKQVAMLDALEEGETKASVAARIRYEIEQGAYAAASPALKAQLEAAAKDLDNGRKQVEVAKLLVDTKMRIAQLSGRGEDAQFEVLMQGLEKTRQELIATGDTAEAAEIGKRMKLEKTTRELRAVQEALAASTVIQAAAEQRINIDRENGLISAFDAQKRLLALHQQEIAMLRDKIPLLERAAAELEQGSPAQEQAIANVERLKNQLHDLETQGTLLQTTFRNAFEQGLGNALEGLATGTLTLKEAMTGLIRDLAASMARLAAQQLASMATAKLMSAVFNKGQSADVGEGASKLQVAGAATAAGGLAVAFGAQQLSMAAKETAAAASMMMVANAMGGFSGGGYTGPGGKYQVAGYVHKGEGVLNQGEIAALGGPSGFYALRGAIANGDLPRFDAPATPMLMASPRYSFADGGMASGGLPAPQVNFRLVNAFDIDELAERLSESRAFERTVVHQVVRNKDTIDAS